MEEVRWRRFVGGGGGDGGGGGEGRGGWEIITSALGSVRYLNFLSGGTVGLLQLYYCIVLLFIVL